MGNKYSLLVNNLALTFVQYWAIFELFFVQFEDGSSFEKKCEYLLLIT